eukprot:Skav227808  [mRNA]  locus=scaffold948:128820:133326:+ [translate_table: standard]
MVGFPLTPGHLSCGEVSPIVTLHVTTETMKKIGEFNPQSISNSGWALATLLLDDQPVISSLAAAALQKLPRFERQSISNFIWSCAKLQHKDEQLIEAIAEAAVEGISTFDAQALSNTFWSFANLECWHRPLKEAISQEAIQIQTELTTQEATPALPCHTSAAPSNGWCLQMVG